VIRVLTVFVNWRLPNDFVSVLDELLAGLFRQLISLALRCVTLVEVVLHLSEQVGIGTVVECDVSSGDFTVYSSEATGDDVVVHHESILTNPIPGRVETAGLQWVKHRLNPFYIKVPVFLRNTSLQV